MTKLFFLALLITLFLPISAYGQNQKTDVVLIWSADTYVPFDYQGKALATNQSAIRVAAHLDKLPINPKALYYNWFLDGQFHKNSSGLNQQSFIFKADNSLKDYHSVRVIIRGQNSNTLGEKTITIKITKPELLIYQTNSFGYNKQLVVNNKVSGNRANFIAEPLFMNLENKTDLSYDWRIDNQNIQKTNNLLSVKINNIANPIKKTISVLLSSASNPLLNLRVNKNIIINPQPND